MHNKQKIIITKSIICALFVFLFGFGVMNFFWISIKSSGNLPGLYDYYAATIGDGFCLPVLSFALSYYSLYQTNKQIDIKKIRRISILVGFISSIIGLGIQISWLINDNIRLNWSIPQAHHFNVAGWYHCIYFISMFFIFAYFFCKIFFIRRYTNTINNSTSSSLALFLISFSGSFYIMLQRIDDLGERYSHTAILLTFFFITLLLLKIFLKLSNPKKHKHEMLCCLSGIITAYACSLLVTEDLKKNAIVYTIVMLLFSFTYTLTIYPSEKKHKYSTILNLFLITLPVLVLNLAMHSQNLNLISHVILCIFSLLIPISTIYSQTNDCNKTILQCKYGVLYQIVVMIPIIIESNDINSDSIASIINILCIPIILWIICHQIPDLSNELINVENTSESIFNKKLLIYIKIGFISIGGLLFLFLIYVKIEYYPEMFTINTKFIQAVSFYIGILILILSLLIMGRVHCARLKRNSVVTTAFLIFAYLSIIYIVCLIKKPFYIYFSPIHICLFFQVVGCSFYISESFFSNTFGIRNVAYKKEYLINTIIIFAGSMLTIITTIFPTKSNNGADKSILYLIVSFITDIIIFIIIPSICFIGIKPNYDKSEIISQEPFIEIVKNGFLGVLIIFMAGNIPTYIDIAIENTLNTFLTIIVFISATYWPVDYCISNNVKHLTKIENAVKKMNTDESTFKQLKALEKHLQKQNLSALFSLLLYCLVPIIPELFISLGTGKKPEPKYSISIFKKRIYPELTERNNEEDEVKES